MYSAQPAETRHPSSDRAQPQTERNILGMRAFPHSISWDGEALSGHFDRTFYNETTIIIDGLGSLTGLSAYAQLPNSTGITTEASVLSFK